MDEPSCKLIEFLSSKGANINTQNNDGEAPLHHAAYFDCARAAETLIAIGASIYMADNNGETPLHISVKQYSNEVAKLLIVGGLMSTSEMLGVGLHCIMHLLKAIESE